MKVAVKKEEVVKLVLPTIKETKETIKEEQQYFKKSTLHITLALLHVEIYIIVSGFGPTITVISQACKNTVNNIKPDNTVNHIIGWLGAKLQRTVTHIVQKPVIVLVLYTISNTKLGKLNALFNRRAILVICFGGGGGKKISNNSYARERGIRHLANCVVGRLLLLSCCYHIFAVIVARFSNYFGFSNILIF